MEAAIGALRLRSELRGWDLGVEGGDGEEEEGEGGGEISPM